MFDADYPAAHSMDTTWFAVDEEGHVAAFVTGESGAMPIAGYGNDAMAMDVGALEEMIAALPKVEVTFDSSVKPEEDYILEHEFSEKGVFVYDQSDWDNGIAGPYQKRVIPTAPISVSQLPANFVAGAVRFKGSFIDAEKIQPVQHWPSEAWGNDFVDELEKNIYPIPKANNDGAERVPIWNCIVRTALPFTESTHHITTTSH